VNRIGLPKFSIVDLNNTWTIFHRGVNRDNISESIKLTVVGFWMGSNGNNFAGRPDFRCKRENT